MSYTIYCYSNNTLVYKIPSITPASVLNHCTLEFKRPRQLKSRERIKVSHVMAECRVITHHPSTRSGYILLIYIINFAYKH